MPSGNGCVPEAVACIWIPQFALCVERARRPELRARPVALVGLPEDAPGSVTPVARACSGEALVGGLSVGVPAHEIPQKCPGAVVLPFDARCYHRECEELLIALDAVTPQVEAQPPEVFYLNLTGLPGIDPRDPIGVAEAVRGVLPSHFPFHIGVASGKFTAWVAAHYATPRRPIAVTDEERPLFLRNAPSSLLPVGPGMARRLDLLGLRTLGRIARLPRSAMLAQFGRPGERAHRLACGEDRERLMPYRPVPVVRETMAFPAAAPTVAHFHLALGRLLQRVWARPERGDRGVRQVRLQAFLEEQEGGESWERTMTLRHAMERWEPAFEELKRRLEPVRPAGTLTELTVELTAFAAHLDLRQSLFPDERQKRRECLTRELSQLRERLGSARVYRIVEVEPWSRLPENRYGLISYDP